LNPDCRAKPSKRTAFGKSKICGRNCAEAFNLQSIYYYRRDGPRGHSLERRARFPRKTGRIRTDVQGWRSSLFRMMDQASVSEFIRNTLSGGMPVKRFN
ncbi:hypothetical protein CEXT_314181, partial [Caerostris extrusa]